MIATVSLPGECPRLEPLVELLRDRRVVVLTGAGCSTDSGIPDYRGAGSTRPRAPVQYAEFVRSEAARARYWARSTLGWPRFRAAEPNAGHRALAELERSGAVRGIVTQNVDGLHQAAGSGRVVELHGSLASVRCLGCGERVLRDAFQQRLRVLNRDWWDRLARRPAEQRPESAPDGDVDLPMAQLDGFRVPGCLACGGEMKPDVVLFGENVPGPRLREAWRLFEEAEVLLVAGSSLTVYSGRRFIYRAREDGVPVAVVNLGPTRADELAAVRVEGALGEVLPRLARALSDSRTDPLGSAPLGS